MPLQQDAPFGNRVSFPLTEIIWAIELEIAHMKAQGGQKYRLTDGVLLRSYGDGYIYQFQLAVEVRLMEGTRAELVVPGERGTKKEQAEILSQEGFDLLLRLSTHLGQTVEEAELYVPLWWIYELLLERLKSAAEQKARVDGSTEQAYFFPAVAVQTNAIDASAAYAMDHGVEPKTEHSAAEENEPLRGILARLVRYPSVFIWGPPGTGKTETLSRLVVDRVMKTDETILVLSLSNGAVDELMCRVHKRLNEQNRWKEGEIVRYGFSRLACVQDAGDLSAYDLVFKNDPDLRDKLQELKREFQTLLKHGGVLGDDHEALTRVKEELNELRALIKDMERDYARRARVVGTSLANAVVDEAVFQRTFDLVIIDEASMVSAPYVLFSAHLAARKMVIC
ncbi:AAA domain-containing protein, partial [Hydrogenibacillus schlegelii]|uniref:AAA domain-containing protein n=1 Tax=Hydrogenibacillus schlegelii TaxID=1484 RepID=UPI00235436D1